MSSRSNFLITRYLNSLTGMGYESNKEQLLSNVLFISSILLSVASAYTTYKGLRQYLPIIIALFITIGINALLFAASWRIGVMVLAENLRWSLPLIFVITLIVSVFFSYSALLDNIYDKSNRESDELQRSKVSSEQLTQQLAQMIKRESNYDNTANDVRKALDGWYSSTVQAYGGKANDLRATLNRNISRYNNVQARLERLRGLPPTPTRDQLIRRNEAALLHLLERGIQPRETQVDRLDPSKDKFDKAYHALVESNLTLTVDRFSRMATDYKNYISDLTVSADEPLKVVEIPAEVQTSIGALDQINRFLYWRDNELGIAQKRSLEDLRQALFEFSNRFPQLATVNSQNASAMNSVLAQIAVIGKYGGANIHPFVLAVGELWNFNYLAVGSLLIAIAIDGLVLLCGLLGARPSSFLTMKRVEDLDDAIVLGLGVVLSLDLENRPPSKSPFINRIVKILSLCEPDVNATKEVAIPATISIERIRSEELASEVGIFLASGLAKLNEAQQKIGLSLRLILWMAEQVYRHDTGRPTANSFDEAPERN